MHSQQRQSRIPEQQGIGQTLPPVPVGIDTMHTSPLPSGAMPNGTRLQVGKYQVIIHNFIAEGGFAHVYLARIEGKSGYVVLKRVAVPDAERLKTVEKEIAFMRRLGDHKYIVRYYESRVDPLPIGGFEALILMEYCPGGGVIDLMNRRLQQRLTEPEILNIFSNVCEALAYMHYCQPPVLHRDLKVENILILSQDQYKLCDFGSAALSKGNYVPTTLQEIQKVEDDVQRHTTLQYRAPEMIDIYQKKPINEKADIWALGVLLYKLCYYTTPFEEQGQLAILNAHYTIPPTPYFSDGLRRLIMSMLQEDQQKRPNIYQVVKSVSDLMHVECPIRNIYQDTSSPIGRQESPDILRNESPSAIFEKLPSPPQQLPTITPMRRGRPNRLSATPPPPSATTAATAAFDPFDPAQVKSHYDPAPQTSSVPSSPPPVKFGFENRFDNSHFTLSNNDASASSFSVNEDEEDSDTTYPWRLEPQTLDPISIPPGKVQQQQQQQQQSTSRTSSLQTSTDETNVNMNNNGISSSSIASTKSTKSIRDFMERKRAPYSNLSPSSSSASSSAASEPMLPTSSSPLPSTIKHAKSSSVSSLGSVKELSTAVSKETPYRPKPPPKPARFRASVRLSATPSPSATASPAATASDTTSHIPSASSPPPSPLRPPSISEFETKFPSVEELYHHLPTTTSR